MKFVQRNQKIEGCRELDPHEIYRDGDVAISSDVKKNITSLPKGYANCLDPNAFCAGNLSLLCMCLDFPVEIRADGVIDFYIKHFIKHGSLAKSWTGPEGATYTIYRKKIELDRRHWQFDPLPLP